MSLEFSLSFLESTEKFQLLLKAVESGLTEIKLGGITSSAKPYFLASFWRNCPSSLLFVTPTYESAEKIFEDLKILLPEELSEQVLLFPERISILQEEESTSHLRLLVVNKISRGEKVLVVTPVRAVLQPTIASESFSSEKLSISKGMEPGMEKFIEFLSGKGYSRTPMVEARGEFAVRGGIIDVYPSAGKPVRIEFWGDTIENIRIFEIETQRSVKTIENFEIIPLFETPSRESGSGNISILPESFSQDSFIVLDEPSRLKLHAVEEAEEEGIISWDDFSSSVSDKKLIKISSWETRADELVLFPFEPVNPFYSKIDQLVQAVEGWQKEGKRIIITSHQSDRLHTIFNNESVPGLISKGENLEKGSICLFHGSLNEGFLLQDAGLLVITDSEILGFQRRRRTFRTWESAPAIRIDELSPGDFVVHLQHGIGQFSGISQMEVEGKKKDFLCITYARGDKLYVPVEQLDLIQKYVGVEGRTPALSRLGGSEWAKTRKKARESAENIARGLLNIYAYREIAEGTAFSPDTPWQAELETSFPYEETPDQQKAIIEVKQDMEIIKPMDRLICGDAGYGKTEVALRAAFKAVMDGKQAAILVPTTLLAEQHYNTFKERLAPFPARVEMLSRFRTPAEQKAIVEALKAGSMDIVIGTHRLLQKDVEFKNLGLVIIDEEQHFGVTHKEKLKEMRKSVDVLTLTATPIPRTLHLSLAGIRDISIIDTPPHDRLPIKTYLFEYHPEIIKGAILRELEREGQIFFIHNRIQGIERIAADIKRLVPRARIAVAHGRLDEDDLENITRDFINGEYDILVCTTIIESGIDMPNVNTIIINNAQNFGLAQLYQLRGRVGRAHHQAYAYLLYPPTLTLTEAAEKRLDTIKRFTAFGSGYQIALKDLEIRGAGNILGSEQSGFIAAVGFDLYCQLLSDAVKELKGIAVPRREESPIIDIPVEAYIPDEYVGDSNLKLSLYKKIARLKDEEEIEKMQEELRDRFGELPAEVTNLLDVVALKILALKIGAPRLKSENGKVRILLPWRNDIPLPALKAAEETEKCTAIFKEHELLIKGIDLKKGGINRLKGVLRAIAKHLKD